MAAIAIGRTSSPLFARRRLIPVLLLLLVSSTCTSILVPIQTALSLSPPSPVVVRSGTRSIRCHHRLDAHSPLHRSPRHWSDCRPPTRLSAGWSEIPQDVNDSIYGLEPRDGRRTSAAAAAAPSRIAPSRTAASSTAAYFSSSSSNNNGNGGNDASPSSISAAEMRRIEAEVEASAMARLDRQRVKKALEVADVNSPPGNGHMASRSSSSTGTSSNPNNNNGMIQGTDPPSKWNIALAAGSSAAAIALLALHTPLPLTVCCFVVVAAYAAIDPLDDDSVFAPLARILGRATIETAATTTPKVKAAILAATTGEEEITALKQRIRELEEENGELRRWVARREKVDENLSAFTLDELRDYARRNRIVFTGRTKAQLFMTLWERGIIKIN